MRRMGLEESTRNNSYKCCRRLKNGVQLRLFYENDQLSYNKKPVGRFGINPKHLIAGIALGIPIGLAIGMICIALLAVPPPTPPPIP